MQIIILEVVYTGKNMAARCLCKPVTVILKGPLWAQNLLQARLNMPVTSPL